MHHKPLHIALAVAVALSAAPTAIGAAAAGPMSGPLEAFTVLLPGCMVSREVEASGMRVVCSPELTTPAVSLRASETASIDRNPDPGERLQESGAQRQVAWRGGGGTLVPMAYRLGAGELAVVLPETGAALRLPVLGRMVRTGGRPMVEPPAADLWELTLSW